MKLSTAQIKHLRSLKLKKYRSKYGQFLVEGDKLLREILLEDAPKPLAVYALPEWIAHLPERVQSEKIEILHPISPKTLERISLLQTPNKAIALMKIPAEKPSQFSSSGWAIYLDGLQDPGNMGTIWRIADWFGFRQIWASPDSVDFYNPKVIQASMGAFLHIPAATAAAEELEQLKPQKDFSFWGADMKGLPFGKWKAPDQGLLVIGSEGKGLSPAVRQQIQNTISIPKAPQGKAESLNAAMATAILAAHIAG